MQSPGTGSSTGSPRIPYRSNLSQIQFPSNPPSSPLSSTSTLFSPATSTLFSPSPSAASPRTPSRSNRTRVQRPASFSRSLSSHTPSSPATPTSPFSPLSSSQREPRLSALGGWIQPPPPSEEDSPHAQFRLYLDEVRQALCDGLKGHLERAEESAKQITSGHDPTDPLSVGALPDTSAPTQLARWFALLASMRDGVEELVASKFAEINRREPEVARRYEDWFGRKERALEKDYNRRLEAESAAFRKRLDDQQAEHQKDVADLTSTQQRAIADLERKHAEALAKEEQQHAKALAEALAEEKGRHQKELEEYRVRVEQEFALWMERQKMELANANNKTAAEVALRKTVAAELDERRADVAKLQRALHVSKGEVQELLKQAAEAAKKKQAEDTLRWHATQQREKEDRQREEERLRREKEVLAREADLRAYCQNLLDEKSKELAEVRRHAEDLDKALDKEVEEHARLRKAERDDHNAQISKKNAALSKAESSLKEAQAQQKLAEERCRAAEAKQQQFESRAQAAEKKLQAAESGQHSAEMDRDNLKKKVQEVEDALAQNRQYWKEKNKTDLAAKQEVIDKLRGQLAEAKKNGGSEGQRRLHDNVWAYISGASLKFDMVAWPVANGAKSLDDLTASAIRMFVLDSRYANGKTDRDRVREAIKTWHPDKFNQRLAGRIADEDKDLIKEGVDAVSKCLNSLLGQVSKP